MKSAALCQLRKSDKYAWLTASGRAHNLLFTAKDLYCSTGKNYLTLAIQTRIYTRSSLSFAISAPPVP